MDGRYGVLRVLPECTALDRANDVVALSQEGRVHLVQAHSAHIKNDWGKYLDAVDGIDRSFREIGETARRFAEEIQTAPIVSPNQLTLMEAA